MGELRQDRAGTHMSCPLTPSSILAFSLTFGSSNRLSSAPCWAAHEPEDASNHVQWGC